MDGEFQKNSDLHGIASRLATLAPQLRDRGFQDAARVAIDRAIAMFPDDPKILGNLSNILLSAHDPRGALMAASKALKLDPSLTMLYQNTGLAYHFLGQIDNAIADLRKVPQDQIDAQWDLACCLLLAGKWEEGWRMHEVRRIRDQQGNKIIHASKSMPEWDGKKVATLWLTAEQGVGDIFQCSRYIVWAGSQCERLIVDVPPDLFPFFYGYPCIDELRLYGVGLPEPDADAHCPLMTLPLHHGTRIDNVPIDPGYFSHVVAKIPVEMTAPPDYKRVGIIWAGNPKHPRDKDRTLPFTQLLKIAAIPDVAVFSFQVGDRARDIKAYGADPFVKDLAPQLISWVLTAAALTKMDLLITCDTGAAHLAGCLGVKTWLLLPQTPDWRWLMHRTDTPWYPSMTLYRQKHAGDWDQVMRRILDDLRKLESHTNGVQP